MAARYDVRGDAPTITRRRNVLACARCRARRVKCDRAQPACSNCVKVGALCQPVQLPGQPAGSRMSRSGSREPPEQLRLTKTEEQVSHPSREFDSKSPSREPSYSPPPVESVATGMFTDSGRLVNDPTLRYLSPYSWAVAAEEILPVNTLLHQSPEESSADEFLDGTKDGALYLVDDQIHETLLETFSQRVDPIIRVLHWPSFVERCNAFRNGRPQVEISSGSSFPSAYAQNSSFDPSQALPFPGPPIAAAPQGAAGRYKHNPTLTDHALSTLLCSVYYAAISSIIHGPNPSELNHINVVNIWSAMKKELTSRLNIMDDSFAHSASIELLQATILFLSMELGIVNPQKQWLQLGAVIHMAHGLGLHRDPSLFRSSPIDCEVRRRLWAQICIVDARLAEQLCREPAINPNTYDTALPVSIADKDLSEIDLESRAAFRGRDKGTLSLQELEQAQEHTMFFSTTTLTIMEAETARQQQSLLCIRYNPRDRPLRANSGSPQLARRAIPFSGRTDRMQLANELQTRFLAKYNWEHLDGSDALQYLVAEICQINLLKIKFISRMTQHREAPGPAPHRQSEIASTMHEALHLATRCAGLMQQYANSPYHWYTRRIRDAYTSSFLAITIASDQQLREEDLNAAITVLDQLFPTNASRHALETGYRESFLEKTVANAKMKREMQAHLPVDQSLVEQSMHSTPGGFATHLTSHPAITLPPSLGSRAAFQSTGNIFEDWDALMQEQIWPASLPNENNYWLSQAQSHTGRRTFFSPAQSPPFEQQQSSTYRSLHPHSTMTIVLDPRLHPSLPTNSNVPKNQEETSQMHPQQYGNQLQVPSSHVRERSASQPPIVNETLSITEGRRKRRSASNLESRMEGLDRRL